MHLEKGQLPNGVVAAALIAFTIAANGQAQTRIPLTLSKVEYSARAGDTVKLEFTDASAATLKRGKATQSRPMPNIEHAPFATMDTEGNLVIAVSLLTPPGRYVVSFQIEEDDSVTRAASVGVSIARASPLAASSGTPVILLNGYQLGLTACPASRTPDGSDTFGNLPASLSQPSLYFDNCHECPSYCSIETLASYLGQLISGLSYSDGTPVQQVDLVAHSMGGLIVRAYLSGKGQTPGIFSPPPNPKVRKAIFIGTPHFGSFLALSYGIQTTELGLGSQFLWDLGRWNQGLDDLREVDAIAIAGNASLSQESDGVVELTSASLKFTAADYRTRIIPACHIPPFLGIAPFCTTNVGIAQSADTITIVNSFLNGDTAWTAIGHSPSQDSLLSRAGGRIVSLYGANGYAMPVSSMSFAQQQLNQNGNTGTTFSYGYLSATTGTLAAYYQGQMVQASISIPAGGYGTTLIKYPPVMTYARPAAAAINTLNIAPGSLISIFGLGLASSTATASFPWPTRLGDVTLSANGQPLQLLYVGSGQINAYFPPNLSGLVTLQLTNSLGQHSLNVMTTNASPALFSADSSGTGLVSAIHATTGQYVTQSNPAAAGEYIEIYGTGFGSTYQSGGLNLTALSPSLYVGNAKAIVTFCGMPSGAVGLYQINFVVPGGLPSGNTRLALTLGNYASNAVTLPIR